MAQEKTFTTCKNHRVSDKCDPRVAQFPPVPRFTLSPSNSPQGIPFEQMEEADRICAECPWFESQLTT